MVDLLLDRGADCNSVDLLSNTSLHVAALYGHLPIVTLLLKRGADRSAKNSLGQTALHHAANNGHFHLTKYLVQMGSDPLALDIFGEIALPWVAVAEIEGAFQAVRSRVDEIKDASILPSLLAELACRYYRKYLATAHLESLEKSIEIWETLVSMEHIKGTGHRIYFHNLLVARFLEYQLSADFSILQDMLQNPSLIQISEEERTSTKFTVVWFVVMCFKFLRGLILVESFKQSSDVANLALAIKLLVEGLDGLPEFVPERTLFLEFLGFSCELMGDSNVSAYQQSLEWYNAAFQEALTQCGQNSYKATRVASSTVRVLKKMGREKEAEVLYNVANLESYEQHQLEGDFDKVWAIRSLVEKATSKDTEIIPHSRESSFTGEQHDLTGSESRIKHRPATTFRKSAVESSSSNQRITLRMSPVRSGLLLERPVHFITGEISHSASRPSLVLTDLQVSLKFSPNAIYEREHPGISHRPLVLDFTPKTVVGRSVSKRVHSSASIGVDVGLIAAGVPITVGPTLNFEKGQEWQTNEPISRISGMRVSDKRSGVYDSLIFHFESKADNYTDARLQVRFGLVLEADLDSISVRADCQARCRAPARRPLWKSFSRFAMSQAVELRLDLEDVEQDLTNEDVESFLNGINPELF